MILLYDGVCPLCNGVVKALLRFDRRGAIRYGSLQSEFAAGVVATHPELQGVDSLVAIGTVDVRDAASAPVYVRARAVRRIIAAVRGVTLLLLPLFLLPWPLLDRLYDFVARRRYRVFGTYDACPMLPPEYRDRFIA